VFTDFQRVTFHMDDYPAKWIQPHFVNTSRLGTNPSSLSDLAKIFRQATIAAPELRAIEEGLSS
jgi:hypothetical protein